MSGSVGVARSVVLAFLALVAAELVLQARAEMRTGESAFDLLGGQRTFVLDPALGFYVLRPNALIAGRHASIRSNRYGLRGADFPPEKARGEIRIVLLGASTIMGVNARDESGTSSALLQDQLTSRFPAHSVRVVNGGLHGLTIEQQQVLLRQRLLPLRPDVVVWYPGSNDVGCSGGSADGDRTGWRAPGIHLPSWVILDDIIRKNTAFLRQSRAAASATVPTTDWAGIEQSLKHGIRVARDSGATVMLVAPAYAFRQGMDADQIAKRAASALGFRPCYSATGYIVELGRLARLLEVVAAEEGVSFMSAADSIPADERLFSDATHFSLDGEQMFATSLSEVLADLMAPAPAVTE
jgi:lysophospholipase L1-like esterase